MRFLLALSIALLVFAPSSSEAQSGRQRPAPSASPAPNSQQRPRRTVPAANQPGQPSTPDAPSMTTTTPTPEPAASRPATTTDPASKPADDAVEIDDGEVVRVTSNLVPVSATVTDARGKAVTDLTVDDFELRVDGQPKPIGGLSHSETPVRLVMLFDNSDSIRASREFEKQAAIRFFKSVLRPVDQAAIYSVDSVYALEQSLTNDVPKLVRTLQSFDKPEGATRLFDAMAHAAEYLRLQPGRKVIVIVSDGADTVSDLTYDETLRRVIAADCQVYAVQTGIIENANLYDLLAVRRLEVFSDRTGGAVYVPKGFEDLDAAFAQIAADLAQQYVLSYYPTDEGRDAHFRTINLRVKTRPNLRVRARRGYYPRLTKQQLSSLPERFSSTVNPDRSSDRNEPSPDLNPPLTIPREVATNARAAAALGSPSHGNKNMDPETSGDAPARSATDLRVTPAKAELKPAPPKDEPPPDLKSESPPETKPTPAAEPSPAPAATPAPTPTPTPQATSTPTSSTTQTPAPAKKSETQPAQQSPPAPEDASKNPISVGQLNAKAVRLPKPLYPETARRMRAGGVVVVQVTVDESGKVVSANAVSGHATLRDAAVAAARQARFAPALVSGKPMRVSGFITYNFSL